MREILFGNGFISVRFKGPPALVDHALNYFAPDEGVRNETWTVVAAEGADTPQAMPAARPVKGEYGEPLLVTPDGSHLMSLVSGVSVHRDLRRSAVTVTGDRSSGVFMETYRAIRQILVRSLLPRGAVLLHASAVTGRDGVTVFVGSKGAGKTSSVWQSLWSAGGELQYVANERVLLVPGDSGVRAFGWPSTAFVGLGTIASTVGLEALDGLHDRAGGTAWLMTDHRWIGRRLAAGLAQLPMDPRLAAHKVFLLPGEVACATKSSLSHGGPLRRIVLPRFRPEGSTEVRAADPDEVAEVLRSELLTGAELRYPDVLGLGDRWNTEIPQELGRSGDLDLISVAGPDLWCWRR